MVVGSISHEIESPLEAKRLWNAFVKDGHNLLPKQVPELFKSVTFLQGEVVVGSIKQINFTPANKDFSYVKEKVDEVNEEKVEEVDFSYVVHFDSLPGVPQDEEKVKEIKEMSTALFEKIEAYLIANPNLYC
ncbi:hypothetical protein SUGI_0130930 [Cryptomeria japonica]|uniref:pathogenesis-related protein 2-like n=1 Tax=Cryptomeria japonica TaxID=3369 RepID=UPI002408E693|nr:pathogenesis-related protein 2-like [Cryptomeria japonica]GLJ10572.1 hypothetical protein SUGI_0130930 [Cryptomeria japonica]